VEIRASKAVGWARLGLVLFVVVAAIVAQRLGLYAELANPSALPAKIAALGALGYVAFVVTYALVQPFGVPGTVFVVLASLVWPWPVAFALSMTGTMAASSVGFGFARFVARDFVERRIPARFRKYDDALEKRGFLTVAILRFVFWMPPLLHAFFGVSKVRFWTHFWGSFVGYLVPLFVMSYFGPKALELMKGLPPAAWAGVAAVLLSVGLGVWAVRRARARRESLAPRPSEPTEPA